MQLTRSTWLSTSVVRRPLVFDHTETQSGRPGVLGSQSHGLVFFTVGFFGSETAAPAQDHSLSLRRATRVRALKGGKRDYAIGWKRPSESPSLSHRKLVPMGFAGPSVPIQKPIDSHRNNVWMGSRGAATIEGSDRHLRTSECVFVHLRGRPMLLRALQAVVSVETLTAQKAG